MPLFALANTAVRLGGPVAASGLSAAARRQGRRRRRRPRQLRHPCGRHRRGSGHRQAAGHLRVHLAGGKLGIAKLPSGMNLTPGRGGHAWRHRIHDVPLALRLLPTAMQTSQALGARCIGSRGVHLRGGHGLAPSCVLGGQGRVRTEKRLRWHDPRASSTRVGDAAVKLARFAQGRALAHEYKQRVEGRHAESRESVIHRGGADTVAHPSVVRGYSGIPYVGGSLAQDADEAVRLQRPRVLRCCRLRCFLS